jgi:Tol biopolymer transport system component
MPVAGGPPRRITDRPQPDYQPDWSPDGQWIVFASDTTDGPADLWVVPAAGGDARQLTFDEHGNTEPAWSPDGKWIAVWTNRDNNTAIGVIPFAGGEPIDVGVSGNRPRWAPDSRRICYQGFTESGDLLMVSVDGGDPVHLAANAEIGESGGATWSPDGSKAAYVSADGGRREIWIVKADGSEAVALTSGASAATGEATVRWSPDGVHIAFVSDAGGQKKVWIVPAAGGEPRPVSTTPGEDLHMAWSPDSKQLAISSGTSQASDIWVMAAAGGTARRLVASPGADTDPDWSPDGNRIAFASTRPHGGEDGVWNLWTVAASGGAPVWLAEGRSPHWSPDGSPLLHVWDNDAWTVPVEGGEAETLLALSQESMRPRWGPDGQSILYPGGCTGREMSGSPISATPWAVND